jgi:hypothetical protein
MAVPVGLLLPPGGCRAREEPLPGGSSTEVSSKVGPDLAAGDWFSEFLVNRQKLAIIP